MTLQEIEQDYIYYTRQVSLCYKILKEGNQCLYEISANLNIYQDLVDAVIDRFLLEKIDVELWEN